jgi:hypothetical protein
MTQKVKLSLFRLEREWGREGRQAHNQTGAAGLQPLPQRNKKVDFVNMMKSYVLCILLLSRNQPLELADDLYIGILKNETKILRSLRGTKKTRRRLALVI